MGVDMMFHEILAPRHLGEHGRITLDQLSELLSLGRAEVFPRCNFDQGRALLWPGPRYALRLTFMPYLQLVHTVKL